MNSTTAQPIDVAGTLREVIGSVKLGVKGPGVNTWGQSLGLSLPTKLYDVQVIGTDGRVARVGTNEIIVEFPAANDLVTRMETSLQNAPAGVYRIEQQSRSLFLSGDKALQVFAQTCGVKMADEPHDRIIYTRVAGVSCGIIPLRIGAAVEYLIWVDPASAPYLGQTLATIARQCGKSTSR